VQPSPAGTAAETPAPDTAGTPADALPVEPTSDGGSSVESQSTDQATESETPTPEDDISAEDDGEDEGTEVEQTEEQKRLSRRERQRLREQERIDKAVEERIAAREREREQAEAEKQRQAQTQEARETAAKEFAEYIGEPGESDRLTAEIADLNRQIRSEIADPRGVDLDDPEKGLLAQVAKKEARQAEIARAQGFQAKIANNLWNGIEAHVMSPLQFPELAGDQAAQARFLGAEGGIAGALKVAREIIRTKALAEKDAEIATLKESHQTALKALEADRNGWRVRAGGSEVADTSAGGQAALSGQLLTPERYAHMTFDQRQKLRSTPEGRAQIDAMSRRTGAA
jgi:colicin import membrane protein